MPYSYPDDVPSQIRGLPVEAQRIFIEAYNAVYEKSNDDNQARMAGWAAVKHKYTQHDNGEWMPMKEAVVDLVRYVSDSLVLNSDGRTSKTQVMRTGTFYHANYGKFTITEQDMAQMVKNFHEAHPLPPTELVVDYDHLSVSNNTPEGGKAAGWIKDLVQEGSKLFALVEWTNEAAQLIKDKVFRFISPQFSQKFVHKETNKNIGHTLLSAALTNRPFLEGMEPVIVGKEIGAMAFSDVVEPVAAAQEAGSDGEIENKKEVTMDEKLLRETLGLSPEGDIAEAIKSLKDKVSEQGGTITGLQAQITQFTIDKEKGEKLLKEQQATSAVTQALADRKILPKQSEWAKDYALGDPKGFEAFVADAPVVGPELKERGGNDANSGSMELTESEISVGTSFAKAMGVPVETHLKTLRALKSK